MRASLLTLLFAFALGSYGEGSILAQWSAESMVAPGDSGLPIQIDTPLLESDGENYLLVFHTWVRGWEARKFDRDGHPVGQRIPLPWSFHPPGYFLPRQLAGNGRNWLFTRPGAVQLIPAVGPPRSLAVPFAAAQLSSNGREFLVLGRPQTSNSVEASVVDEDAFFATAVPRAALPQESVSAASDGTVFCVAGRDGNRIVVNFVDRLGRPSSPEPRTLYLAAPADGFTLKSVEVARRGSGFIAVWLESKLNISRTMALAFDSLGNPTGEPFEILVGEFARFALVQAGPGDVIVRWPEAYSGVSLRLSCLAFPVLSAPAYRLMASNGHSLVSLGFSENGKSAEIRRSSFGCDFSSLNADQPLQIALGGATQAQPALSFGATEGVLVWSESAPGEQARVRASRIDADGSTGAAFAVAEPENPAFWQSAPAVATGPDASLVVWAESYNSQEQLRMQRLDGTSAPRNIATVDRDYGCVSATTRAPRVVWNGTYYLVVWTDGLEIRLARVTAEGVLLDPGGRVVSARSSDTLQFSPAIATNGAQSLLVWQDLPIPCSEPDPSSGVRAVRLDREGLAIDTTALSASGPDTVEPSVRWAAFQWIVTWRDRSRGSRGLHARQVSDGGDVLDAPVGTDLELDGTPSSVVQIGRSTGILTSEVEDGYVGRVLTDGRRAAFIDLQVLGADTLKSIVAVNLTPARLLLAYVRRVEEPYAAQRLFVRTVTFPRAAEEAPRRRSTRH